MASHNLTKFHSGEGSGLLVGWQQMERYTGVCRATLRNWERKFGFPVARMPDGSVAITKSLIDLWLLSRREYQESQRAAAQLQLDNVPVPQDDDLSTG